MSVNIDIEIRENTSDDDKFIKVVIFEVETIAGKGQSCTVCDIYHADDYTTAVNLLPEFLNQT